MTPDEFKAIAFLAVKNAIKYNVPAGIYQEGGFTFNIRRSEGWIQVGVGNKPFSVLGVIGEGALGVVEVNSRGEVAYQLTRITCAHALICSLPPNIVTHQAERGSLNIRSY